MNNVIIRRVVSENISQVIPGIVNVFRDDEVVPWHRYETCLAWVTKRVERGFYMTLACDGDKIIGYSEWIETYDNNKKIFYLGLMQVDCDLRSRGIGKLMLDDGEKYARIIGASYLRTIPDDERSHNFYRKYGFVETDAIYYCSCPTSEDSAAVGYGKFDAVTLEIANTHEFIFGLCQSSGRHMYEVANHNPELGEYITETVNFPNGYLQFRHHIDSKTALAIYWSNEETTAETVSAILSHGRIEGFDEMEFYFKSKYLNLFAGYNITRETTELEREIIL